MLLSSCFKDAVGKGGAAVPADKLQDSPINAPESSRVLGRPVCGQRGGSKLDGEGGYARLARWVQLGAMPTVPGIG